MASSTEAETHTAWVVRHPTRDIPPHRHPFRPTEAAWPPLPGDQGHIPIPGSTLRWSDCEHLFEKVFPLHGLPAITCRLLFGDCHGIIDPLNLRILTGSYPIANRSDLCAEDRVLRELVLLLQALHQMIHPGVRGSFCLGDRPVGTVPRPTEVSVVCRLGDGVIECSQPYLCFLAKEGFDLSGEVRDDRGRLRRFCH